MNRVLTLAVLLAVLQGVPALACKYCDAPVGVAPKVQLGAEPFDLRNTGVGLSDDEKAEILADDGGRYAVKSVYFLDTKAADPDKHLLTFDQVIALLKARAARQTAELQKESENGKLGEDERKLGFWLYWSRGSLLTQPEIDFLKGLNPIELGKVAAAKPDEAPTLGPVGADLARQKQDLYQKLKAVTTVEDGGDPKTASLVDGIMRRLLDSSTAREMSEQMLAAGGKVRIRFEDSPHSAVIEKNGVKILSGSAGNQRYENGVITVTFNKLLLQVDPIIQQHDMPDTLGHEMLGHGLLALKADKAGVTDTNAHYRGDEARAGLTGWLVNAELGGKLDDGWMWTYLKNPESYHDELHRNLPYYAGTFSIADMADPMKALMKRKTETRKAIADVPDMIKGMQAWTPRIEHFVKVHGMKPESLNSVRQSIDNAVKVSYPTHLKNLQDIDEYLDVLIAYYSSPVGKKALAKMKTDASNAYFSGNESDLTRLRDRLQSETSGMKAESLTPPQPGQVTWDEFEEMYKNDLRDHPKHWPDEK